LLIARRFPVDKGMDGKSMPQREFGIVGPTQHEGKVRYKPSLIDIVARRT